MSFGKCPSIARQTNGQIVLAIAGLDLRIGYFHRRTIATLVERHTRYVILMKIANKDTEVISALIKQAKTLPNELISP